jgi:hypothetical protein
MRAGKEPACLLDFWSQQINTEITVGGGEMSSAARIYGSALPSLPSSWSRPLTLQPLHLSFSPPSRPQEADKTGEPRPHYGSDGEMAYVVMDFLFASQVGGGLGGVGGGGGRDVVRL